MQSLQSKAKRYTFDREWNRMLKQNLTVDGFVVLYKSIESDICNSYELGVDSKDEVFITIKSLVEKGIHKETNKDIYKYIDNPEQDLTIILLKAVLNFNLIYNTKFFTYFQHMLFNTSRDVSKFRNSTKKYSFNYNEFAHSQGKSSLIDDMSNDKFNYVNKLEAEPDLKDDYDLIECYDSISINKSLDAEERKLVLLILSDPTIIRKSKITGRYSMDWKYLSAITNKPISSLQTIFQKNIYNKMNQESLTPKMEDIIRRNSKIDGDFEETLDTLISGMVESIPDRVITFEE